MMEEEIKQEETTEGTQKTASDKAPEEVKQEKPLDRMTAKELREVAMVIPGVEGVHAMKKEDLLAVIKEYRGIVDEGPKKKKGVKVKKEISVGELKKKISTLHEEKKGLAPDATSKERNILRRRINRLKKQTRKVA